jgi:hypothetical protein
VKRKKYLSCDTAPAEIRTAKLPETSQKLYCVKKFYLRDNICSGFQSGRVGKVWAGIMWLRKKWYGIKGEDFIDCGRGDKICATWRSSAR